MLSVLSIEKDAVACILIWESIQVFPQMKIIVLH